MTEQQLKFVGKQELLGQIEQIPKFVLRDAAQKDKGTGVWIEDNKHSGVTEEDKMENLAYVSKRYKLVQFVDVFKPLLSNISALEGCILYDSGVGAMVMFPEDQRLVIENGDKIGLMAYNSVNKTSSIFIKFSVKQGDKIVTIPRSVAGFKRMHVGKAVEITSDFLAVVDKVRDVWGGILKQFEKIQVNREYVESFLNSMKVNDKHLRKTVLKDVEMNEKMNLWDVFMKMLSVIEDKKYKSDMHRQKRLDKISDSIFKWAIAGRLIDI